MRHTLNTIISFLVFALLIQNTCPFGMAGKSTVAASCSHCTHKQVLTPPSLDGQATIVSDHASPFPLYVLAIPQPHPALRLMPAASPRSSIPNSYKDALPEEHLRPPRA
jgi:hypothetical protein